MRQGTYLEYEARMMSEEFAAGEWVERLGRGLAVLAAAQEPYLAGYREMDPRLHAAFGALDGIRPAFPWSICVTCTPGRATADFSAKKGATRRYARRWWY